MRRRSDLVRDLFLLALTAGAGAFDAASFLRMHSFTANMTGNTVLLGLALGGRHLTDALHNAVAIAAFAAGAFLGAGFGREASDDDPWPAATWRPFLLEIALVVAFAICWSTPALKDNAVLLLILGAGAMGVQSGITHDIHHSGASTTYMTGTIARTFEYIVDALRFGFRGGIVLNGLSWIVYVLAAVGVGAVDARGGNDGAILWVVVAIVTFVAVTGRAAVLRAAR